MLFFEFVAYWDFVSVGLKCRLATKNDNTIFDQQRFFNMEGFSLPSCRDHQDNPATHICFQSKAKYACTACLTNSGGCSNHPKYVMDISAFVGNIEETSTNLEQLQAKCQKRHSELTNLAGRFKAQYAREEDENMKSLMKIIETESKEYRQMSRKANTHRNKLLQTFNLIRYFQPFHDPQLLEMKLNLSSPKGLRVFLQKSQNHSSLLNKRIQTDLKKVECELQACQKRMGQFQSSSFTVRLRQLLKSAKRGEEKPVSQMKIINIPVKCQQ